MATESILLPRRLGEKYLAEAKGLLNAGDFVQASEKLWGTAALTVKMVAAKRGLQSGSITAVTPWILAAGFAISLVLSIVSGLYPARRAARLNPLDALRQI